MYKNFCTPTDGINKMERQHTKWEKILANYISDEGLIPGIFRELLQLNNKNNSKLCKEFEQTTDISTKKIHRWPIST
jgi:hypothetical protein